MAKYKIIPSSRTIVQSPISIGHKAEKGVEAIEFDVTAWVETYGSGTLTVIMRRWGDAIPYPIALEIDENNKATWTLSDTDTAKAGMAYAQLSYIVGDEVVKKSDIYTFRVMDSLTGEGDPPEAYESWLEHLTHLAAEAMAEVLDIEGVVTDKTLTVNGGIADAKATGDALSALEDQFTEETDKLKADLSDIDESFFHSTVTKELSSVSWVRGYIRNDGTEGNATNICRNTSYLTFDQAGFAVAITVGDGFKIQINEFSSNNSSSFIGRVNPYVEKFYTLYFVPGHYYRITIMKTDESALPTSDIPANVVAMYMQYLNYTDKTLSTEGIAADAKVTGASRYVSRLMNLNEGTTKVITAKDIVQGTINNSAEYVTNSNRLCVASFIEMSRYDILSFTPGTNVAKLYFILFDDNFNKLSDYTLSKTTDMIFKEYDHVYCAIILLKDPSAEIVPSEYDAVIKIRKSKHLSTTIHMEKGRYDTTEHRYGGPWTNFVSRMINKYPILVENAVGITFNSIQSSNNKLYIFFRDQTGTDVRGAVGLTVENGSCSYTLSDISSALKYIDIEISCDGLYDVSVDIAYIGSPAEIKETKRIYANNNNEMINYFAVEWEKQLYTAMTLMLPPNYTNDGEKVPLVIWFDGNGNYSKPGSGFSSVKMPGLTYVRDEGFAVAQIFAWGCRMNDKYPGCGRDMPYPTPTCLKILGYGINYICDRFNIDPTEVHIMSKSMGGLISLYFVTHPVYPFKTIGMFSPILDMFGLRGRYPYARRAIFEDMDFAGDVEEFADISFEGDTSTGVPNYYFSPRCCENTWAYNLVQLAQLNSAWASLIGDTFQNNYDKSVSDAREWYSNMYATGIYNHNEYKKIGKIPVKIWGAVNDNNVPYQAMPEIINQFHNAGLQAEMETKQTGGHSVFDVDGLYAQDITTRLGILHEDVPLGWIENVEWIRRNSIKYNFANNDE